MFKYGDWVYWDGLRFLVVRQTGSVVQLVDPDGFVFQVGTDEVCREEDHG